MWEAARACRFQASSKNYVKHEHFIIKGTNTLHIHKICLLIIPSLYYNAFCRHLARHFTFSQIYDLLFWRGWSKAY